MVIDTDVTNASTPADQPIGTPPPADAAASEPPRTWSMPKAPVTRQQVDAFGRTAATALIKTITALAGAVAGVARYGARAAAAGGRAIEAIPLALRLLLFVAVLMLCGIAGSIGLTGTPALLCAVIVVPVCSIAVGALGHRWFGRHDSSAASHNHPTADAAELTRSVTYVDGKLTLALNSLGSERHQQAVIALFQAKTAVELALGTERDHPDHDNAPVSVDAYRLRPRIQAGPSAKTTVAESNALAAS